MEATWQHDKPPWPSWAIPREPRHAGSPGGGPVKVRERPRVQFPSPFPLTSPCRSPRVPASYFPEEKPAASFLGIALSASSLGLSGSCYRLGPGHTSGTRLLRIVLSPRSWPHFGHQASQDPWPTSSSFQPIDIQHPALDI